jgi:hypothetical protein
LSVIEIHFLLDYVGLYIIKSVDDVLLEFFDALHHLTSQELCFPWGDLLAQHSNRHDKIFVTVMDIVIFNNTWALAIRACTNYCFSNIIHLFWKNFNRIIG